MSEITASALIGGTKHKDIPVLNPGDYFGKCYLIEIGGSYWPLYLIVEADSVTDALDVLAGNQKYGHQIVVDDADLGDYPEESRFYSAEGKVLDLDHVQIYGEDGKEWPFPCRYHSDGLPIEGISSIDFANRGEPC